MVRPKKKRNGYTPFYQRIPGLWRHGLTLEGQMLTIACVGFAIYASPSLELPLFHIFTMVSGLWGVAFLGAWWFRPRRLRIDLSLPKSVCAGETFSVPVLMQNRGKRRAYSVQAWPVDLPKALDGQCAMAIPRLEAGEVGVQEVELQALHRGDHGPIHFTGASTFPLPFFRWMNGRSRGDRLLVYPNFTPLHSIQLDMGKRFQPGGIALVSNTGESPEYIGNREYRPGDPVRCIDFKAWARLAKPAVREYQEEYLCRVALMLDTYVPGRGRVPEGGYPNLENAISLCASVADVLARGEYIIDLFAAGPELYVFRAGRNTAHLDNVLEILAGLDPCRENPFQTLSPVLMDELGSITTLIMVVLDWDDSREAIARAAKEHGCAVKVIGVGDMEQCTREAPSESQWFDPDVVAQGGVEVL